MAKKNPKLTRKEIFMMLFDIATTGKYWNYHDWALKEILGEPDDPRIGYYRAEQLAQEKLFELFIKE